MIEKVNTITRKQRLSVMESEFDKIFELITSDKVEEMSNFIINPENKIWEIKKAENLTVLHNACAVDKVDMIEAIIEKTKKRLGLYSQSNLTSEKKEENEKIFKDFINAKTDGDSQTALHYASFRGNIKVIKLLILNHAEINTLTFTGYNMIHKAAMGNKPSAIIFFNKKYNMNLEDTDENQMNALHLATRNCMENSVIYLLSLGIDPNLKDKDGNTALHYAVRKNQNRIIKKLLQHGADKEIPDFKTNKTPVMLAKNKPEILEIFRKKGVCEKLFFKPDISKKTLCSNKNMFLFIILHVLIIFFVFFILFPYFDNLIFSIVYVSASVLVFLLYSILSLSNPGKMVNVVFNDLLDLVDQGEDAEEYCPTCIVKKKFRSRHCLICQKCIDDFDHHCFWVGNCIGKNNYTLFFIFLIYILLNTLFNMGVNIYYLVTEIGNEGAEKNNTAFPGFYFGEDCFIYKKYVRIIVSIVIFIICILFFIPLFNLFRMQLSTALEKKQTRIEEEEYERAQLKEKLDEEVWEDLKFEDDTERDSIKMNMQLLDFDSDSNKKFD